MSPEAEAHEPVLALGHLVAELSAPRGVGRLIGWGVSLPGIGPLLARAMRAPLRITWMSSRITRLHAVLLRRSRGRLRRSWLFAAGQPVLSLTTTGRRTGMARSTAVACFIDGDDLVLAAMNLGRERNPSWAHNLMSDPRAEIELNGKRIPVRAQRAQGTEADRLWRRWVELQPSATAFRDLASRDIPIFVLGRD
jgi:deazaflavin-dependent oxidoreductase (nitroreductase family)